MGYYTDAFQHCETLIKKHVPRLLRESAGTEKSRKRKPKKPAAVVDRASPLPTVTT